MWLYIPHKKKNGQNYTNGLSNYNGVCTSPQQLEILNVFLQPHSLSGEPAPPDRGLFTFLSISLFCPIPSALCSTNKKRRERVVSGLNTNSANL